MKCKNLRLMALTTMSWFAAAAAAIAQQPAFSEISPKLDQYFVNSVNEDFWISSVASADVDGDADLDMVALGYFVVYAQSVQPRLVLLRNNGTAPDGRLQLVPQAIPIGALSTAGTDMRFADVDADGDPDLLVASTTESVLFRNIGGTLLPTTTQLPRYAEASGDSLTYDLRSITFADSDNDGDQDLLMPSAIDTNNGDVLATLLMRNDGPNGAGDLVFSQTNTGFAPTYNAQTQWADDDGDGDLDVLITHIDILGKDSFVRIYRNNGAAGFAGTDVLPLRVQSGMTDWADADADGDLDILVAGGIEEPGEEFSTVLRVYRKQANGYVANELAFPSSNWFTLTAATWADYDSDGDIDILVTGNVFGAGKLTGRSEIYANNGSGNFTALDVQLPAPDTALNGGGAFAWMDIDADGDLDYFVSGAYFLPDADGLVESRAQVFRNITPATNAAPAAPTGITALTSAGQATLSWLAPLDDHTSVSALTYDIQIARADSAVTETARLPQSGTINQRTSWHFNNLLPGAYQWSVQAVDAAYAGSSKARGVFQVGEADTLLSNGFE